MVACKQYNVGFANVANAISANSADIWDFSQVVAHIPGLTGITY